MWLLLMLLLLVSQWDCRGRSATENIYGKARAAFG
jgi:hypothetical protein